MLTLLKNRRIRLFYLGSLTSTLGDYALFLALGVWVKLLTGSTAQSGVAVFLLVLGGLAGPLTGPLVDRVKRKPLMIGSYAFTGLVVLSLLFVHDRHQVWIVYVVSLLYGVSGTVTYGAQTALVKHIVPEALLADANGLEQTVVQGMRLVTPALGVGLLAWLGGHAVTLLDAATFAIAAGFLQFVDADETTPQPDPNASWLKDTGAGFRHVARTAVIRQLTVAAAVALFFMGFYETLGLQIATVGLHHAPTYVGVIVTVMGVGGVAGGLTAAPLARRLGEGRLVALGLAVMAVVSATLAVPADAVVLAASALFGATLPWLIVGSMTLMQKNTPAELMGRVSGAAGLAMTAPQSLGIAACAAVVGTFFYRSLCFAAAIGVGLAAVYLATRREQRMAAVAAVEPGAGLGEVAAEVAAASIPAAE